MSLLSLSVRARKYCNLSPTLHECGDPGHCLQIAVIHRSPFTTRTHNTSHTQARSTKLFSAQHHITSSLPTLHVAATSLLWLVTQLIQKVNSEREKERERACFHASGQLSNSYTMRGAHTHARSCGVYMSSYSTCSTSVQACYLFDLVPRCTEPHEWGLLLASACVWTQGKFLFEGYE